MDLQEQVRHTCMTGGTGIITTKDGKIIAVLASTIKTVNDSIVVETEMQDVISIPKETVLDVKPAY